MIRQQAGFASCTACGHPLPGTLCNTGAPVSCPRCQAELEIEIFPALLRPDVRGSAGEAVEVGATTSGCFFHPHKVAVRPCDSCGRFLCTLCEVALGGRHLCPSCFESGRSSGRIERLVTRRTLHDQAALSLAVYPMLFIFATLITAPIAIWMAIRHWNSPRSLLPRTRIRLVAAIVIAALQLLAWITILFISIR